jgi:hypothetical protein
MGETTLLEKWKTSKLESYHYQLESECSVEYEFRRPTAHATNYAFARFLCRPSETLAYTSSVVWSADSPESIEFYETYVGIAIVDELMGDVRKLFRGCSIHLIGIRGDPVGSSPMAFYLATRRAMEQLKQIGTWRFIPPSRKNDSKGLF